MKSVATPKLKRQVVRHLHDLDALGSALLQARQAGRPEPDDLLPLAAELRQRYVAMLHAYWPDEATAEEVPA